MVIGLLTLKLHFPEAQSLKEKRFALRSLIDRLRNRHNVSVAEVGDQDLWQSSILAVAHLNTDKRYADSILSSVLNLAETDQVIQVVDVQTEFL
jgi:uncharacterized protein YlxP (DUF503 family)